MTKSEIISVKKNTGLWFDNADSEMRKTIVYLCKKIDRLSKENARLKKENNELAHTGAFPD